MTTTPPGQTDEARAYLALNRRVYRWLAPVYDCVTLPIGGLRRAVARALAPRPGARVLDCGTGTGAQAAALAAVGASVVGIDLSPAMLRVARGRHRRTGLALVRADATVLPFRDRAFDGACVSFALHEMPDGVRTSALREIARVTRAGGAVAAIDYALPRHPLARWLVPRLVGLYERDHYGAFVRQDLVSLLAAAGLAPVTRRPLLGGLVQLVVGRRGPA